MDERNIAILSYSIYIQTKVIAVYGYIDFIKKNVSFRFRLKLIKYESFLQTRVRISTRIYNA